MLEISLLLLLATASMVLSQQIGTQTPEHHPPLTWQKCTKPGACTTVHGSVVMDHAWRWIHTADGKISCLNSAADQWDSTACPDPVSCAKNCHLDGVNYAEHGITTSGSVINMKKDGSRLYLMANETSYEVFKLLGQEITFDVDMSKLPCGKNAAIYLVAMEHDGGGHNANNKAGAKYGTGYCDGQCPKDRWINGAANALSGASQHGACCAEFDMWEANSYSTVYTSHPCTVSPYSVCTGKAACDAICEHDGCGFNSYNSGHHEFYGPGKTVNTDHIMTVVTQFITSDGTAHGELTDIRRFYVQNGHVIPNSVSTLASMPGHSMTKDFCKERASFNAHGGLKSMGEGINHGMVLVFSLWGEINHGMEWLDQPPNGPCPQTPKVTAEQVAVAFSNIRVGAINATFHA